MEGVEEWAKVYIIQEKYSEKPGCRWRERRRERVRWFVISVTSGDVRLVEAIYVVKMFRLDEDGNTTRNKKDEDHSAGETQVREERHKTFLMLQKSCISELLEKKNKIKFRGYISFQRNNSEGSFHSLLDKNTLPVVSRSRSRLGHRDHDYQ